jgi:hypothetical protein
VLLNNNPKVTENRETLGRLIDIAIYLGRHELAFGGHNENENSFDQGNFRELAKLLRMNWSNIEKWRKLLKIDNRMQVFHGRCQ